MKWSRVLPILIAVWTVSCGEGEHEPVSPWEQADIYSPGGRRLSGTGEPVAFELGLALRIRVDGEVREVVSLQPRIASVLNVEELDRECEIEREGPCRETWFTLITSSEGDATVLVETSERQFALRVPVRRSALITVGPKDGDPVSVFFLKGSTVRGVLWRWECPFATATLEATLYDSAGNVLIGNATWRISDPEIATFAPRDIFRPLWDPYFERESCDESSELEDVFAGPLLWGRNGGEATLSVESGSGASTEIRLFASRGPFSACKADLSECE